MMSSSMQMRNWTNCSSTSSRKVSFNMDCLTDFFKPEPVELDDLFGIFAEEDGMNEACSLVVDSVFKEEPASDSGLDDLGDLADLFTSSSSENGSENDPLTFNLEDFGGLDEFKDIKTDLMWSSTLDDNHSIGTPGAQHKKARRRDASVTLSECVEGFLSLRDMELTDNIGLQGFEASPILGNGFCLADTPMATSDSDTETGSSTEEEEIDVVNEDVGSSRTRVHRPKSNQNRTIEAGRSLLRVNRKPQPVIKQKKDAPVIDHMKGDHSYFLVRPKPSESELYEDSETILRKNGALTPSESGDDDRLERFRLGGDLDAPCSSTTVAPENIDKRKIAAAVQNLIKNKSKILEQQCKDVKFRFKMRFGSGSPQPPYLQQPEQKPKSLLIQQRQPNRYHPYAASSQDKVKRKSASQNMHCSNPFPLAHHQQPVMSPASTPLQSAGATMTTRSFKIQPHEFGEQRINPDSSNSTSRKSLSSKTSKPSCQEDKSREIRDLHNRMERQRRVDLKNNYDQLKECIPALDDIEKASKLNILNKATDHCRLLTSMDAKLRKEMEKEKQCHQSLRKRMSSLVAQLDGSTRLSSGRLSLFKTSRFH